MKVILTVAVRARVEIIDAPLYQAGGLIDAVRCVRIRASLPGCPCPTGIAGIGRRSTGNGPVVATRESLNKWWKPQARFPFALGRDEVG